MFTPYSTDIDAFQTCQTRRMREIRAEVEQIRLAKSIQQPKTSWTFKLIRISLALLSSH
jgi:hypothetical protein